MYNTKKGVPIRTIRHVFTQNQKDIFKTNSRNGDICSLCNNERSLCVHSTLQSLPKMILSRSSFFHNLAIFPASVNFKSSLNLFFIQFCDCLTHSCLKIPVHLYIFPKLLVSCISLHKVYKLPAS